MILQVTDLVEIIKTIGESLNRFTNHSYFFPLFFQALVNCCFQPLEIKNTAFLTYFSCESMCT